MIQFQARDLTVSQLQQLRELFLEKWDQLDPFEGPHRGFEVPGPIAALDGISIVGGLAYTSALVPGTGRLGLWINAVMVIPQYRRQGIATELIRHALAKAALTTHNRLYVFTDRPELYKGWKLLQQLDGSSIFHTTIVR